MTGCFCTTNEALYAQTERQPRMAIRRNQPIKKTFSLKKWLIGSFSTVGVLSLVAAGLLLFLYVRHLEAESLKLQGQVSYLQAIGKDNAQLVAWFNKAVLKTQVTAYVPYLGGINGGGKAYANGEPVIPLAASRQALKSGTVAMGDYVLLVGQIKDTKGTSIEGHSIDIQVPDLATAMLIGKRPFKFANLSRRPVPGM